MAAAITVPVKEHIKNLRSKCSGTYPHVEMTAAPLTAKQNTAHYTEFSRSFVCLLGAALRDKGQKSIKDWTALEMGRPSTIHLNRKHSKFW